MTSEPSFIISHIRRQDIPSWRVHYFPNCFVSPGDTSVDGAVFNFPSMHIYPRSKECQCIEWQNLLNFPASPFLHLLFPAPIDFAPFEPFSLLTVVNAVGFSSSQNVWNLPVPTLAISIDVMGGWVGQWMTSSFED